MKMLLAFSALFLSSMSFAHAKQFIGCSIWVHPQSRLQTEIAINKGDGAFLPYTLVLSGRKEAKEISEAVIKTHNYWVQWMQTERDTSKRLAHNEKALLDLLAIADRVCDRVKVSSLIEQ